MNSNSLNLNKRKQHITQESTEIIVMGKKGGRYKGPGFKLSLILAYLHRLGFIKMSESPSHPPTLQPSNPLRHPGMALKEIRIQAGVSQIQMAEILETSQSNLSAIENGHRAISREMAHMLGNLLKMDYHFFLS